MRARSGAPVLAARLSEVSGGQIVKDKPLDGSRAKRWARGRLDLSDDAAEVAVPRRASTGHTCGFAKVDGTWRCIQDFLRRWLPA